MSLRAFLWVVDDPRCSDLHASSLRVLLALADHAHEDGTSAWTSASRLAQRLSVSERTVERCVAQLREKGLIRHGDQSLVANRRADRRPVVWDLDMPNSPTKRAAKEGDGGRADSGDGPSEQDQDASERADTVVGPSTHGPSRNAVRADTNSVNGPTPGVGQNRHSTVMNRPSRASAATAAAVGDLAALDAWDDVAYCRRCGGQHGASRSCTRSMLPVPVGGLRALRDAVSDAS